MWVVRDRRGYGVERANAQRGRGRDRTLSIVRGAREDLAASAWVLPPRRAARPIPASPIGDLQLTRGRGEVVDWCAGHRGGALSQISLTRAACRWLAVLTSALGGDDVPGEDFGAGKDVDEPRHPSQKNAFANIPLRWGGNRAQVGLEDHQWAEVIR